MKLLIINYLFPPAGGIAVQRALSLAKYLPQFGFEVHVLSAGNAAAPVQDPRLLKHVPPSVTVHHSFTPELPFALQQKLWGLISPPRKAAEGVLGTHLAEKLESRRLEARSRICCVQTRRWYGCPSRPARHARSSAGMASRRCW